MPSVSRTYGPLHFEDLEPKRFEDLVRQLVYDFRQWRVLEATGRAGSDDGFDARGFELVSAIDEAPDEDENKEGREIESRIVDDRQWLIQCKREKTITPKKLVSYLDDIPEEERKKLHGIIFVAACDFSKKAHDAFRGWCARHSISEAYLWGKAQIEDFLYQPKNDGLLFAYIGISLQIRKRSIRTVLRTRLAMKRKSERILSDDPNSHSPILLRDPSDDRYPYKPNEEELKKSPMKWKVKFFCGHHPKGLQIETRSCFAYVGDDNKSWDYVPSYNAGDVPGYNRWIDKDENWKTRKKIEAFWSKIPEINRAWFNVRILLPCEDIYDIDEKGDSAADFPHIYLDMTKSGEDVVEYLQPIRGWARDIEPDPANRIKFFPDDFLEVEDNAPELIPIDE